MEKNTFATSAYIATSPETAYQYLCNLKNLDEWTLYSRMLEQMDENTWRGTASGYQKELYYHVKQIATPNFRGIEWHCGFEYQKYFQVYPVLLFPSNYIEPNSEEAGVYFHWLSFVDPGRQTPMIMQGIETVHTSECRSLKANLERKEGYKEAVKGRYFIDTDTIYINAPIEMAIEYLQNLENMNDWAHLMRSQGQINDSSGDFLDEYDRLVRVSFQVHQLSTYYLIEQNYYYPDYDFIQRSPTILIPCTYAFGDRDAPGLIQHRITFWSTEQANCYGKLQIHDYGAESMNIKRLLEAQAGNLDSFNQGMSYTLPDSKATVASI